MVINNCQNERCGSGQSGSVDVCNSDRLFGNLVWLTTEETAQYLRKSINAIRILVYRRILRARKFRRRLYFRRTELDTLIETSQLTGGLNVHFNL